MNQLVAQGIRALQDDREHSHGLVIDQGEIGGLSGSLESGFPLFLTDLAIMEIPEGLVHSDQIRL